MNSVPEEFAVPRLVATGLSHRFGANAVLHDLSFDVGPGEILCVVGPSGCGKSTLLRLVAGLEHVQEGALYLDGELIASPDRHLPAEARGVGLVFQDFALFPHMSLRENVAFGLAALPPAERRARALDLLGRVGLADRAEAMPHELSGGQQQRVALARALAPQPRLMLLDEPFSNLDVRLRQRVRAATRQLLKDSNTAAILVTHDPDEAMVMADRIALLRQGRLVQIGSPIDLYRNPVDAFAAEFFGDVNHLSGVVRAGAVDTALGAVAAPDLSEGTPVAVLVRPEAITPVPSDPAHRMERTERAACVRIVALRPLGAQALVDLELSAPAGPIRVQAMFPMARCEPVGASLDVRLDPGGVFVFAAG